jgi:hypothetical protein
MFRRRFPNGFKSWHKTHYHVVQYITGFLLNPDPEGVLLKIVQEQGQQGLYDIAIEWAWLYEDHNRYREIEPERKMNEIRNFCEVKNLPW